MRCHACQEEASLSPGEPLGFRAECARCAADLHVCLNCGHHDPAAYNACREPSAERVLEPDRANRCDYFRPASSEERAGDDAERGQAMRALEALFGDD